MKRLALTLALVAGMFFAANTLEGQNKAGNNEKQSTPQTSRPGFVDNNGDGVCDNYDGQRPGKGLGPGNGNGEGRGQGKGLGRGNKQGKGEGRGNGLRDGSGGGNGNFVDRNNNGTCDNRENGTAQQHMRDGSGGGTGQKK